MYSRSFQHDEQSLLLHKRSGVALVELRDTVAAPGRGQDEGDEDHGHEEAQAGIVATGLRGALGATEEAHGKVQKEAGEHADGKHLQGQPDDRNVLAGMDQIAAHLGHGADDGPSRLQRQS